MTRFRDLPIQRKLAVANLVTSGIAVLLVYLAFFGYEVAAFRRDLREETATQAAIRQVFTTGRRLRGAVSRTGIIACPGPSPPACPARCPTRTTSRRRRGRWGARAS